MKKNIIFLLLFFHANASTTNLPLNTISRIELAKFFCSYYSSTKKSQPLSKPNLTIQTQNLTKTTLDQSSFNSSQNELNREEKKEIVQLYIQFIVKPTKSYYQILESLPQNLYYASLFCFRENIENHLLTEHLTDGMNLSHGTTSNS